MYIQDINTNKKYVFNQICFDGKCSLGQVLYIFDPTTYNMTGILYDGCSFIKDKITSNNPRTRELLSTYIDSQDPLDYSYTPNDCRQSSSVTGENNMKLQ